MKGPRYDEPPLLNVRLPTPLSHVYISKRPFVTRSQRELDVKARREEHRVVTAASMADAATAGAGVSLGGMTELLACTDH